MAGVVLIKERSLVLDLFLQVKQVCSVTNSIGINFQVFMHTNNHN